MTQKAEEGAEVNLLFRAVRAPRGPGASLPRLDARLCHVGKTNLPFPVLEFLSVSAENCTPLCRPVVRVNFM